MNKVLIINHTKVACGTYQFAKRIYDIVKNSEKVDYVYRDVENRNEYLAIIKKETPNFEIINWHKDRIDWLLETDVTENKKAKHYFLFHDGSTFSHYDKYIFSGEMPNYPTSIPVEKSILLPRPLIDYKGIYPVNQVPTIGSFGFATDHKRFPELVTLVNETFKEAHIRLHITSPYFGVTEGYNLPKIITKCHENNINPKVKLTISSNFVDDQALLNFLASNDVNVFNYAYMNNPGISSAVDYALSVKRPFAVTKNNLFRHVAKDEILLECNTISDIMDRGLVPFEEYYDKWSTDNFRRQFNEMFT